MGQQFIRFSKKSLNESKKQTKSPIKKKKKFSMYFYKENKKGAKIFNEKYVGPILIFAHLNSKFKWFNTRLC